MRKSRNKFFKSHMWVCELDATGEGWVCTAALAFDTRAEARDAAKGMFAYNLEGKSLPTRVRKYVRAA